MVLEEERDPKIRRFSNIPKRNTEKKDNKVKKDEDLPITNTIHPLPPPPPPKRRYEDSDELKSAEPSPRKKMSIAI